MHLLDFTIIHRVSVSGEAPALVQVERLSEHTAKKICSLTKQKK